MREEISEDEYMVYGYTTRNRNVLCLIFIESRNHKQKAITNMKLFREREIDVNVSRFRFRIRFFVAIVLSSTVASMLQFLVTLALASRLRRPSRKTN